MPLRILIADDNPLVRYGIRVFVESHGGWMVCGEAADGIETVEKAVSLKPDLVLLDISMPNLDGIEAAAELRENLPGLGIIIVTLHDSIDLAGVASRAGAWGYVTKSLVSTDLLPTIEAFEAAKLLPAQ
jgi:DNA-binding NarL/FixJ family response regulator